MKRKIEGKVVSDKMQLTAVVEVARLKKHSKYLKHFKVTKRFKAHNPENKYKVGDMVVMEETRPLSKDKHFTIISMVGEEK
ncbi:MAG: 30S ribosomal protein S17 [Candidatus Paceibacterota bacterium]